MFNICKKIDEIKPLICKIKSQGKAISLVPTMGSLHNGHLQLIKKAKLESDFVIVSIFVNQKQFNQKQDYDQYPRNLEDDLKKLGGVGVDAVFVPTQTEIYVRDNSISIDVGKFGQILCGKDRSGHFNAVALIIIKLFSIVTPDVAIFGLKDFQQFFIIKKLVNELNIDVKIIAVETIREKYGLALSSRNLRLSNKARLIANDIYSTLHLIRDHILNDGPRDIKNLLKNMSDRLLKKGFDKIIYLEIRSEENLDLSYDLNKNTKYRIFISAIIEDIRLIDNLPFYV